MAFNFQKLSGLVKHPKKKNNIPKLVIGINQVDNLGHGMTILIYLRQKRWQLSMRGLTTL